MDREKLEQMIVRTIIEDAIDLGYDVVIHDGEQRAAHAFTASPDGKEFETNKIMAEAASTDEQHLIFFNRGVRIGQVYLVYGNDGHDVIADHTDNEEIERIIAGASELAEKMEAA